MIFFASDEQTVNFLTAVRPEAEGWAWNDRLLQGRCPSGSDLNAFSTQRSELYRTLGWDEDDVVESDFLLRNEAFRKAVREESELTLVFGSSVVEITQLAQIVSTLIAEDRSALDRVSLLLFDRDKPLHADRGLESARPLDAAMAFDFDNYWRAFVSEEASSLEAGWQKIVNPQLKASFGRTMLELPSVENGLSLLEAQVLDAVELGVSAPRELFLAAQQTEELPMFTDWEFWLLLERLLSEPASLLALEREGAFLRPPVALNTERFSEQRFALTERGRRVLRCEEDYLAGAYPPRWLGGFRIASSSPAARWDYARRRVREEALQSR